MITAANLNETRRIYSLKQCTVLEDVTKQVNVSLEGGIYVVGMGAGGGGGGGGDVTIYVYVYHAKDLHLWQEVVGSQAGESGLVVSVYV